MASFTEQLVRLRAHADACRRTAIALDAKLRTLEPAHHDLGGLRAQLAATSARIDRAVDGLCARGHLPERLARPRR